MPSWPTGVTTVTLVFGKGITIGGNATSARLTAEPVYNGTDSIVWAADGTPMLGFSETAPADEGVYGSVKVPVVDQDGWLDGTLAGYKRWAYKLTETPMYGRTPGKPRVKYWQPVSGQTSVDFDLIPDGKLGSPVSGPLAVVTSVNGQTGAVIITGSGTGNYPPVSPTPPNPAFTPAWIDTTTVPPTLKGWDGTQWVVIGSSGGTTPPGPTIPDNTFVTDAGDYLTTEAGDYLIAA